MLLWCSYLISDLYLMVWIGPDQTVRGEEVKVHPQRGAETPYHTNGSVGVGAESMQSHGVGVSTVFHLEGVWKGWEKGMNSLIHS